MANARRPGEPIEPIHHDFAATLQETLERLVLHVMTHAAHATGERTLCYAGGVAHNAVANGKVLGSGLFEQMFVQGGAHDAGGAIGAALWTSYRQQCPPHRATPCLMLGPHIGPDDAIGRRLSDWQPAVSFTRSDDIVRQAACALASGLVIGWAQGRAEFGPRALGHRSILADPRPAANREIINAMVKKREAFRPFAPMVLDRGAAQFFELPTTRARLADMTYVVTVRPEWRVSLGAVTHVDGTARIQVISRAEHPLLASLLEAFEAETGLPILLNTSFNNDAEPIVTSIDDAITCFLTTELNALAIGPWWVEKGLAIEGVIGYWAPSLRGEQRLTADFGVNTGERFAIESNADEHFAARQISVSPVLFEILKRDRGALLDRLSSVQLEEISNEVISLWRRRAIRLLPPRSRANDEA